MAAMTGRAAAFEMVMNDSYGPEVPSATAYQNTLFDEVCLKHNPTTQWLAHIVEAETASLNTVSQHTNLNHCVQHSKSPHKHCKKCAFGVFSNTHA